MVTSTISRNITASSHVEINFPHKTQYKSKWWIHNTANVCFPTSLIPLKNLFVLNALEIYEIITVPATANKVTKNLPQTGEKENQLGLLGIVLASLGLFGLGWKKREHE